MNLNIDVSKYMLPGLGVLCGAAALMMISGMRTPVKLEAAAAADAAALRIPSDLVLEGYIPTMDEVVAKHLFVPERVATGENAFPDLLVKGVYVGVERNAIFSLKSKPEANLRVWQGDEEGALAQVEDDRDPRRPIVDFLSEWEIKSIDFAGVTVEHIITGEVETYEVDYKPAKHVKDNAQSGYGQGKLAVAVSGNTAPSATRAAASARPGQPKVPTAGTQAVAGRVGAYMQRMSPRQRQQFMQQLQRQNAAANQRGGAPQKNGTGTANTRKAGAKRRK